IKSRPSSVIFCRTFPQNGHPSNWYISKSCSVSVILIGCRTTDFNLQRKNTDSSSGGSGFPPASNEKSVSADASGLEEKLDKIIEQNARMIEILESFGE
ncbi:hypothetical protein HRED_03040, partial [Candidatus Haloredivivus sp. G17]